MREFDVGASPHSGLVLVTEALAQGQQVEARRDLFSVADHILLLIQFKTYSNNYNEFATILN